MQETINHFLESRRILMLGDYVTPQTPALFGCEECGHMFDARPANIFTMFCPECEIRRQVEELVADDVSSAGVASQREAVRIYTEEKIREEFAAHGYKVLMPYTNKQSPLPVECAAGHRQNLRMQLYRIHGFACPECNSQSTGV